MSLLRIWDYIMRRKPLLVAFFVVLAGGVYAYNSLTAQSRVNTETMSSVNQVPVVKTVDNGLVLNIFNEKQEPVYRLTIQNNFQEAIVEVNPNSLASEAYVRILDSAGNLVAGEYTTIYDQAQEDMEERETQEEQTVQYFFPGTPKRYQIVLADEMKVELKAQNAKIYSTLDNVEIPELSPRTESESYIFTVEGLRRADQTEVEAKAILYQQMKCYVEGELATYRENIPEHVLYNKSLDAENKAWMMQLYAQLAPEDQAPYTEFVEQLKRGGVPVITYRGATEYKSGEVVDLLELFDIYDNEDGKITNDNLTVSGAVDFAQPGTYELIYAVKDSDGNEVQYKLNVTILDERVDVPSQIPGEERPIEKPIEGEVKPDEAPSEIGAGVGVTVDDDATGDEVATVWSAQDLRVDYEKTVVADEEMENDTPEPESKEDQATKTTPISRVPEENTTQTTPTEQKPEKDKSSKNFFIIVLGVLACCGLVKFICDHYVR